MADEQNVDQEITEQGGDKSAASVLSVLYQLKILLRV